MNADPIEENRTAKNLLYIASGNAGKIAEIRLGVDRWQRTQGAQLSWRIDLLPEISHLSPCVEDADTFAGNARRKALHYGRFTQAPVLADDSGLVVDSLDGAPGVYSARYAGPAATDEQNNRKLLEALRGMPGDRRTARFVCTLTLAQEGVVLAEFSGEAQGTILEAARGSNGFGYDPLFLDTASGRTFAELTAEEKLDRSHRGKALFALLNWLSQPSGATR